MNAEFEKYAQEQLSGHEMSVDAESLWADIYPQVKPNNSGNNKRILGVFLLGLLVGLAGFGLFSLTNNNSQEVANTPLIKPASEANNDTENTVAANQQVEAQIAKMAEDGNAPEAVVALTSPEKNKSLVEQTAKEAISSRSISKTQKQVSLGSTDTRRNDGNNSQGFDVSTSNTNSNAIVVITESDDLNTTRVKGSSIALGRDFQAAASLPTLLPERLIGEKELSPDFLNAYKTFPANFSTSKKKSRTRKGAFFRGLRYGIGFYGGISSSSADLEAKNDADQGFVTVRTNSEKQLETLHLGLNALIVSDKNVYLRTGVEYSRIGSLFSQSSERVETDSVFGIIEIEINSVTGDSNIIRGNVPVTRKTSFVKKTYNYFHLIDVPVIFGYNFGNDPWRIGVEAGIYANVYVKRKGDIALEDGSFYDIGEDDSKWYNDNIGISPFVGINGSYNVTQNIQVHLSPSFRFNSLFSSDANPLKEQHGNLGVQAGIRYLFD